MAQQTQTPGGQKKSSGAAPPATGAINGFLGGLRSFFSPAPPASSSTKAGATSTAKGSSATTATRPPLNLRKVIIGFLLLLVGVYAIQFLLLFIDLQVFKGMMQRTVLVQVPFLGPLTIFSALALGSMIGLYILLYRLDLLPRANRAAQASAASANNRARTTATKKPVEKSATVRQPVSGPNDDEYEQARMAQRARRRRDARK
jgi:hypothetical protein